MSGPIEPRRLLHPTFELRADFIVCSFSIRELDDEKKQVRDGRLRVGRTTARPWVKSSPRGNVLKIGQEECLIDQRYDYPPQLEDEWHHTDIKNFQATASAPVGPELFSELKASIIRHVDLGEEGAYVILALWPAQSFTYPAFPAVSFLSLAGPKETGKSQTLDVLAKLCRCGHKSRPTAASLGDMIESQRAIFLIDQADQLHPELIEVLVDSYRVGASRTVTDMDHRGQPHRFATFGPKAFASHRALDDDLLDRCIQLPMAPAVRPVEHLAADDDRLDCLRWQLYRYTVKNFRALYRTRAFQSRPEIGEELGLKGRELELWWPFEVLFEWLDVPDADRTSARGFYQRSIRSTKASLPEEDEALLRTLAELANSRPEAFEVRSDELSEALAEREGVVLDPARLGKRLREQNLVVDQRRVRTNKGRLTVWTLHPEQIARRCQAWRISESHGSDGI